MPQHATACHSAHTTITAAHRTGNRIDSAHRLEAAPTGMLVLAPAAKYSQTVNVYSAVVDLHAHSRLQYPKLPNRL
jgi:hypothetical protein